MRNIGIDLDREAIDRFAADHPVELVHGCYHKFLSSFEVDENTLVYADPSYLKSTCKVSEHYRYRHDYEKRDHVRAAGYPEVASLSGDAVGLSIAASRALWIAMNGSNCFMLSYIPELGLAQSKLE